MKKLALIVSAIILFASCNNSPVEKPEKLIDEETMANIIYDLTVLEAMKARDAKLTGNSTSEYVYKKYHIDSVQFVRNNQYYAAEIDKYKKIYEKVNLRIEREKKTADSLAKAKGEKAVPATTNNASLPQIK
jgi:phage FluMu gp28-like protein